VYHVPVPCVGVASSNEVKVRAKLRSSLPEKTTLGPIGDRSLRLRLLR